MTQYVCNLVIPGAAKSGTSSLHELLDQHSKICMSRPKEPHHFAIDSRYHRGPAAHNCIFRKGGEEIFFGESSTLYMPLEKVIGRIEKNVRNPKIIFLLRDPLERCISHYKWMYRLGYETRQPRRAFEEDGFGLDPEKRWGGNYKSYLGFSSYSRCVPMWEEAFGSENVLCIRSDDFKRSHQEVAHACFKFLGLKNEIVSNVSTNETSETFRVAPPAWLGIMEKWIPVRLKRLIRYKKIRNTALRPFTRIPPEEFDDADLLWLKQILRDDIEFFESISGI